MITASTTAKRVLPKFTGFPRKFSGLLRYQEYRSDETIVSTLIVALDGTGDFDNIQAAIDALPDTGGKIEVKGGIYTITSAITINKSNLTISGAGKSTKIVIVGSINGIYSNGYDNIIIEDIYVYGGDNNTTGIYLRNGIDSIVRQCYVENFGLMGINLMEVSKSIVQGNFVSSCGNGIVIQHNSFLNMIFVNNTFSNHKNGILLYSATDELLVYDNTITNNISKDNDVDNTTHYNGIHLSGYCHRNIISNNKCQDNDGYEIFISTSTATKNTITGNILIGTDHEGSLLDLGTDTQIGHNTIS